MKTIFKPCFLWSELDTRFFQISITCKTSFRVTILAEVIFKVIFPVPTVVEVDELPLYIFFMYQSVRSEHLPVGVDMVYSASIDVLFSRIYHKVSLGNHCN